MPHTVREPVFAGKQHIDAVLANLGIEGVRGGMDKPEHSEITSGWREREEVQSSALGPVAGDTGKENLVAVVGGHGFHLLLIPGWGNHV